MKNWTHKDTDFIITNARAGRYPTRADVRLDAGKTVGRELADDEVPFMPAWLCYHLAVTTTQPLMFWKEAWGNPDKLPQTTREGILQEAVRIVVEIEDMFAAAEYWNRHVRKEGEPTINPDPEGEMSRTRARLMEGLKRERDRETKILPVPELPVRPAVIGWCPAFGAKQTEHLWSQPFDSGEGDCRECLWCFERRAVADCGDVTAEQGGALCDFPGCLRPAIRASMAVNAVGAFCCQEHWDLVERGNHNEKEAMEIAGARMNRKSRSPK